MPEQMELGANPSLHVVTFFARPLFPVPLSAQERQLASTPHSASSASTPSIGIMSDSNASTPVIHGCGLLLCLVSPLRTFWQRHAAAALLAATSQPSRNPSPSLFRGFGSGPTPRRGHGGVSLEAAFARQQEGAGVSGAPNMRLDEFAVREAPKLAAPLHCRRRSSGDCIPACRSTPAAPRSDKVDKTDWCRLIWFPVLCHLIPEPPSTLTTSAPPFQAKYTSEDNASFLELVEKDNERKANRALNQYAEASQQGLLAQRQLLMLEGPRAQGAQTDGYGTSNQPYSTLIVAPQQAKNQLYFFKARARRFLEPPITSHRVF